MGMSAYNMPMRKLYFPRRALARRLERLYDDIDAFRLDLYIEGNTVASDARSAKLLDREASLAEVCRLLRAAGDHLDRTPRLS